MTICACEGTKPTFPITNINIVAPPALTSLFLYRTGYVFRFSEVVWRSNISYHTVWLLIFIVQSFNELIVLAFGKRKFSVLLIENRFIESDGEKID